MKPLVIISALLLVIGFSLASDYDDDSEEYNSSDRNSLGDIISDEPAIHFEPDATPSLTKDTTDFAAWAKAAEKNPPRLCLPSISTLTKGKR